MRKSGNSFWWIFLGVCGLCAVLGLWRLAGRSADWSAREGGGKSGPACLRVTVKPHGYVGGRPSNLSKPSPETLSRFRSPYRVKLLDARGTPVAEAEPDIASICTFENLSPGKYTVQVQFMGALNVATLSGAHQTKSLQAGDDAAMLIMLDWTELPRLGAVFDKNAEPRFFYGWAYPHCQFSNEYDYQLYERTEFELIATPVEAEFADWSVPFKIGIGSNHRPLEGLPATIYYFTLQKNGVKIHTWRQGAPPGQSALQIPDVPAVRAALPPRPRGEDE